MEDNRITLDDITDKFVKPINSKQNEKLLNILFKNNIPFDSFNDPSDNREIYKISSQVYQYFIQEGIDIELVQVRNIGSLSSKKRNEIKRYNRSQINREKAIKELREKYGSL